MRRIGLLLALFGLFGAVGLGASGCTWTETRQDFPPNAIAPLHPGHGHGQAHR